MNEQLYSRSIDSPVGLLTLVASDEGLRAIRFPVDRNASKCDASHPDTHPILDVAQTQLDEYFAGDRTDFELDLDLRGTDFQVQVWLALAEVPYGKTSTYGAQAKAIGRSAAVRAVGAANGQNPVPIVLPCHRIIGKDGSLTGFAGGLPTKRFLLDHESGVSPLPM